MRWYGSLALEEPEPPTAWLPADEFVLGEPPTRLEIVRGGIARFADLLLDQRVSYDDRPPVVVTVSKLGIWLAVATAISGSLVAALGSNVARAIMTSLHG